MSPGKKSANLSVTRVLTPLGPMFAAATDKGLCLLEFCNQQMIETQLKRLKQLLRAEFIPGKSKYFDMLNQQLKEYFAKERQKFDIPLEFPGTDFQISAWQTLQKIPYGKTWSYEKQAMETGKPKAIRAIAKANSENRISIIIPCHRVIGKNGKLTGYGGGLWRKKFLLELEENQTL
ncbi:MAG: methylated-DNA--[protein]-cysteine S-methyltransferase [Spirochaetia bacterium]|nr:methylated-DNA--[protein]-cysteine S-methyltransferase [Spirochaetia bacterium]